MGKINNNNIDVINAAILGGKIPQSIAANVASMVKDHKTGLHLTPTKELGVLTNTFESALEVMYDKDETPIVERRRYNILGNGVIADFDRMIDTVTGDKVLIPQVGVAEYFEAIENTSKLLKELVETMTVTQVTNPAVKSVIGGVISGDGLVSLLQSPGNGDMVKHSIAAFKMQLDAMINASKVIKDALTGKVDYNEESTLEVIQGVNLDKRTHTRTATGFAANPAVQAAETIIPYTNTIVR